MIDEDPPDYWSEHERRVRLRCWAELGKRYDLPSPERWEDEVLAGWTSDGVTMFFDRVCGVSLGSAGDEKHYWPPRPATLHDFQFGHGGGEGRFRMTNALFRDYCEMLILELRDPKRWSERQVKRRVRLVYWAVRTRVARRHFTWRRA